MRINKITYLLLFGLFIFESCQDRQLNQRPSNSKQQVNLFKAEWAEIDKLEQAGAGESIIKKADQILFEAKKQSDYCAVFKALAYRSKYIHLIREESTYAIIKGYESEIDSAAFPSKNILHSALAELYVQYFEQNRWRFQNRTDMDSKADADLRSWTEKQVIDRASHHYLKSCDGAKDLRQEPIENLAEILSWSKADRKSSFMNESYKSLYDLLMWRSIKHFKNIQTYLPIPLNWKSTNNTKLLGSQTDFLSLEIESKEKPDFHKQLIPLYQSFLRASFEENPLKNIRINLDRLDYFHQANKQSNSDSLYLKALNQLEEEFPAQAEIKYKKALLYKNLAADKKESGSETYLKKAHDILISVSPKDSSYGARMAQSLAALIEQKRLSFMLESIYPEGSKMKFQFNFKNIDSSYFRLIPISKSKLDALESNRVYEDKVNAILELNATKTWSTDLKNTGDFQDKALEMELEPLEIGHYVLLASNKAEFTSTSNGLAFQSFQISNLAYISRRNLEKEGLDLYTLDRKTGLPLADVEVEVRYRKPGENKLTLLRTLTSPKSGRLFLNTQSIANQNLELSLSKGQDILKPFYASPYYNRFQNREKRRRIELFTDRAIYRPGQVVYFKGIALLEKSNINSKPDTSYEGEVRFLNVKGEEVEKLSVKTNLFGSFQGSFQIPESGLTGIYSLSTEAGTENIRVENYKRPSFKIELDSLIADYRIGDSVALSGKLKGFAGQSVGSSTIRIRISQETRYRIWSNYQQIFPPMPPREISQDEIQTDSKGTFSFRFLAEEDPRVSHERDPIQQFKIQLEAISPSGETQSKTKFISINRKGIIVFSSLSEQASLEDIQQLLIHCKNLAGKELDYSGNLELIQLEKPKDYVLPKMWHRPDYRSFNQSSHSSGSMSSHNLGDLKEKYRVSKSTVKCNEKLNLFKNLKPGPYLLRFSSKNKNGESVQFEQRFVLFDAHQRELAMPSFHFLKAIKADGKPGDTAELLLGTSTKNMKLLYEIELQGKIIEQKWIALHEEQKKLVIPITYAHQGGIHVHITGIHSNRKIQYLQSIEVPFVEKKLDVQLKSYRKISAPQATENWRIEIKNHQQKGDKFEVLASMYDASLDQFGKKEWQFDPFKKNQSMLSWNYGQFNRGINAQFYGPSFNPIIDYPILVSPELNWFGFSFFQYNYRPLLMKDQVQPRLLGSSPNAVFEKQSLSSVTSKTEQPLSQARDVQIFPLRKDFRETVFFFPQLTSEEDGKLSLDFKMPDALTEWKFRLLAHGKNLESGIAKQTIRTQKSLMVIPNAPRFFREGDKMIFQSLVSNMTDSVMIGEVKIKFTDPSNNYPLDILIQDKQNKSFTIPAKESRTVEWSIGIPEGIAALQYQIIAHNEHFSDGEEKLIPILSKRMQLTESLPFSIRAGKSKNYQLEALIKSKSKPDLKQISLTLEYTSNPAWMAVQALPYISEGLDDCSEKVFASYFSNSIANQIVNKYPDIKNKYATWKADQKAFESELEKNEAIKLGKLKDSPWVNEAKSEKDQRRKIARFFDENRIRYERSQSIEKLSAMQLPSGAWPWFKGMRENRFLSQYIISGLGHLHQMSIHDFPAELIEKGISYLDQQIIEDYKRLKKDKALNGEHFINSMQIHYLYARSYFKDIALPTERAAFDYYLYAAGLNWQKQSNASKAMIAIAINRYKPESEIPTAILNSLSEYAILSEEMGMYWKNNEAFAATGSEISSQALLIEAFAELGENTATVEELKLYLLKQKQTNAWPSSKSSAEACYALFLRGENLLQSSGNAQIQLGNQAIFSEQEAQIAGTGYFKKVWLAPDIRSNMGNIQISNQSNSLNWAALHWQFEQDLSEIEESKDQALVLERALYKKSWGPNGEILVPIEKAGIQVGDILVVRLIIRNDRELDFVHLKDYRAAGMEPIELLSGTKHQDGMTYYLNTEDSSTNFFIEHLGKGYFVFEYSLRATISGTYSQGITAIQCMYAPAFSSHSAGQSIQILAQ